MPTPRVYSEIPVEPYQRLPLGPAPSRRVARVLRLRPGDEICVFDGRGGELPARIVEVGRGNVTVEAGAHRAVEREAPTAVQLVQAMGKGEKTDLVIQKAVELGATSIWPVSTARTVVRLDGDRAEKRLQHWRGVVVSACEQCGRNRLPELRAPAALERVLDEPPAGRLRLVLDPRAEPWRDGAGPQGAGVQLLVGPEGGFTEQEVAAARSAGFHALRLGPRILRTETAAIAALAVVQARWGDLGS